MTHEQSQYLSQWEVAVDEYLSKEYNTSDRLFDARAIGVEILDREMMKDGRQLIPYFAAGFFSMIVFVYMSVLCSSLLLRQLTWSKWWVATATAVCPPLAISTTYGLMSAMGMRINSYLLVLPFLIMGIGVDDGFLLMHAWFRTTHLGRDRRRMSMVLSEVGPSITVTTLTNIVSFGVGATTPTPEIRLFCFGTSIALALVYAFQVFFFCSILQLSAEWESRGTRGDIGKTAVPAVGNGSDAATNDLIAVAVRADFEMVRQLTPFALTYLT